MKARLQLPAQILEAERQASQLCRRYQIRSTHSGFMLWKWDEQDGWNWLRPYADRDLAEQYLVNKLPVIESEL